MSSKENLCSPLLQRLLNLEKKQQQCRLLSNDYLLNIKSPPSRLHSPSDEEIPSRLTCDSSSFGEREELNKAGAIKQETASFPNVSKHNISTDNSGCYEQENCHRLKDLQAMQRVKCTITSDSVKQSSEDEIIHEEKAAPKFSYLKKGQGVSRFNVRPLKGFKRKNSNNQLPMHNLKLTETVGDMVLCPSQKAKPEVASTFKNPLNQLASCPKRHIPNSKLEVMSQKQNVFEKLEKLVDQESFCSTSSTVMDLLHEETTFCSTPVSAKASFVATMKFTPILKGRQKHSQNEKCSITEIEKSPVRQLFPPNIQVHLEKQSTLRQAQGIKPLYFNYNQSINDFASPMKSSSSGILKKRHGSVISPSLQKVKFLERGVKVLEYEDSEKDAHSLTACTDESDLVSLSDLENLALLNYNVNVVYEDSLLEDTNSPVNKIQFMTNRNENAWKISSPRNENKIDEQSKPLCSSSSLQEYNPLVASNKKNFEREVQERNVTSRNQIPVSKTSSLEEDNLDTKAHKLLLLSKVEDLNKEVKIFKMKNKNVEQLIADLKVEKENLIKKQKEIPNVMKRVSCTVKPKRINKSNKENDNTQRDMLAAQIKDLNDKLRKLEVENSNLKRKVTSIERKGKAMERDQEINNLNENEMQPVRFKEGRKDAVTRNIGQEQCAGKARMEIPSSVVNKRWEQNPRSKSAISRTKSNAKVQSKNERNDNGLKVNENNVKEDGFPLKKEMMINESLTNQTDSTVATSVKITKNALVKQPLYNLCSIPEEVSKENISLPETEYQISMNQFDRLQEDTEDGRVAFEIPDNSIQIVDVFCSNEINRDSGDDDSDSAVGVVHYLNGDTKTTDAEKVTYNYSNNNVTHTKFKSDGREEIQFPNGQKEIYFPDGSFQLIFADNSSKSVYKDGTEISVWRDGTVTQTNADGTKSVHFPNGQKEMHAVDGDVTRVYPDGTLKILHSDGSQETRYKNGRVRLKDSDGNVTVYKNKE